MKTSSWAWGMVLILVGMTLFFVAYLVESQASLIWLSGGALLVGVFLIAKAQGAEKENGH